MDEFVVTVNGTARVHITMSVYALVDVHEGTAASHNHILVDSVVECA